MSQPRQYPRAERVRHEILRVLTGEIDKLRDPGIGFVTITEVTLSIDMRHAKAYYTVLGEAVEVASTKDALKRATKHLRAAVAHAIRLRYVPQLEFVFDPVPARAAHLDTILAKIHESDETMDGTADEDADAQDADAQDEDAEP